jgi:uncharacterized repeat protein (TIGR02543 family)
MLGFLAMALVSAVLGCSNPLASPTAPGSDKAIIAFGFADPEAAGVVTSTTQQHAVTVTVPSGTDVATLVPTIVISGLSVSPASGVAQDFTSPVTYRVTAADGSTTTYTVTVIVQQASAQSVVYSANGADSGTVPDTQTKTRGSALTLAANPGNLTRAGYIFAGWNTAADGSGSEYAAGATYTADAALALYAMWTAKSSSVTTLASGLSASSFGDSVVFTATVTPGTATGTVTFKDGGATLGTGTLSGGVATFGTSGLGLGNHGITAEYCGDGGFNASASAALSQAVWSGAAQSGNWSDPATWSSGVVPEAGTDVVIGAGTTVTVDASTAALGNLRILGTLTVPGAQTITVSGNLTNNGTFNPGAGYVLSGPCGSGAPTTATFPAAGAKLLFPAGLPQTSLTLTTATTSTISANLSVLPGVRGVANQYTMIKSTTSLTGAFTLVIDYSATMTTFTPANITSVKFLSRQNAASPWIDITTLGATITNRNTDGVQGKFTIEWTWSSCFNL